MCKKTNYHNTGNTRIDKCMKQCIGTLNAFSSDQIMKPVASCCGHGKYSMTIILKNTQGTCWELFTGKIIPRTRNFYKRDEQGYYYIPEVMMKSQYH